jgi:hypothetical protein
VPSVSLRRSVVGRRGNGGFILERLTKCVKSGMIPSVPCQGWVTLGSPPALQNAGGTGAESRYCQRKFLGYRWRLTGGWLAASRSNRPQRIFARLDAELRAALHAVADTLERASVQRSGLAAQRP